ncbi:MAG: diguanylate cyclase [Rhizobiales bacterium]|nr:diguanylate cyclase [Hyphomicrobiales bacterium]
MKPQIKSSAGNEPEPDSQEQDLIVSLLQENERLQDEINRQRERVDLFQSVFDCLPDALAIADKDRAIQVTNPGLSNIFGYGASELVGKKTAVLYESIKEYEKQGRARFNLSADDQLAPYQVQYRRKNGDVFTGETIGTPLRDRNGAVLGYLGTIRDVTDREQAHTALSESERLLALIASSLPGLVAYVDTDLVFRFVNSTAEQWYARPRDELIGRHCHDVIKADVAQALGPTLETVLAGKNVHERAIVSYPDGRTRSVERAYVPDIASDGTVKGFVSLVIDVAAQKDIEDELNAAKMRFSDAISAIPDGFAYYDKDDRLQIFNERYRQFYAKSADLMVLGATFEDIIRGGVARGQYEDAIGREEEWIENRLAAHQNPGGALEQPLDDGRWLRIEERKTLDGGTVGIRVDITEAKERELQLERLAVTDPLTGISNRRAFFDKIQREHEQVCRDQGVMSLLLIDVDHFKRINDTYGHAVGDQVLKQLAAIISGELRGQDAVCRYGGEEFAVYLSDTSMGGAYSTADRIRLAVERARFSFSKNNEPMTVSIGGSQCDHRDKRYEEALVRADRALYRAKNSGRNRVMIEPLAD